MFIENISFETRLKIVTTIEHFSNIQKQNCKYKINTVQQSSRKCCKNSISYLIFLSIMPKQINPILFVSL